MHSSKTSMMKYYKELYGHYQHPKKLEENCHQHQHANDDEEEFSDFSEYSDNEDVPAEKDCGTKIWDYFYILKTQIVGGLNCVTHIYRKEQKNLLHKFERKEKDSISFFPTRMYGMFSTEKKDEYLKVKAKMVYTKSRWPQLVKVYLMEVDEIENNRRMMQMTVMRQQPHFINYKAAKALKLRKLRQKNHQ